MPFNVNEIDLGILVDNMPDLIFYLGMDKKLLSFLEFPAPKYSVLALQRFQVLKNQKESFK